ncbi:divalent-cation tolerance protein CutA [Hydrogenimonas sp.]
MLVTAPNEKEAKTIARKAVEKKLAACVNIVPGLTSVYRWEGKVQEDAEVLMLIKTTKKRLEKLEKLVKKLHSYDVPEFVVLKIESGSDDYLKWLRKSVK